VGARRRASQVSRDGAARVRAGGAGAVRAP